MKVIVGSTNPTKLEAVKQALKIVWPDREFSFDTLDAPSGVNEQPLSEQETIKGATNRAQFGLDNSDADYGVGIEGGMYHIDEQWFVSDWVVIINRAGQKGIGGTSRYPIPQSISQHIDENYDLSAVLEKKHGYKNIGKLDGYAGLTTNNHITRTASNRDATVIALAPFIRDFWNN